MNFPLSLWHRWQSKQKHYGRGNRRKAHDMHTFRKFSESNEMRRHTIDGLFVNRLTAKRNLSTKHSIDSKIWMIFPPLLPSCARRLLFSPSLSIFFAIYFHLSPKWQVTSNYWFFVNDGFCVCNYTIFPIHTVLFFCQIHHRSTIFFSQCQTLFFRIKPLARACESFRRQEQEVRCVVG